MTRTEKIKSDIKWTVRKYHDGRNRKRLSNHNFSLLSCNCTGGVIYHALGLKFLTPTVDLFFEAGDYIKFLTNSDFYISGNLTLIETNEYTYPLIQCEDI